MAADDLLGLQLFIQVGDEGWCLDFTNTQGTGPVVTQYDTCHSTPTGAPLLRYKSAKVFSMVEEGKLSEMAAFVTGKISFTGGDAAVWEK